jgi:hypothetical protein
VKTEISNETTLALYDPQKYLKVSADASSSGLGAVAKKDAEWRPISFASRSMSETECPHKEKGLGNHSHWYKISHR